MSSHSTLGLLNIFSIKYFKLYELYELYKLYDYVTARDCVKQSETVKYSAI